MTSNSWKVQRSILFELDTLFSLVNDYLPRASLSDSINHLLDSMPAEMTQQLISFLGPDKQYFSFLFSAGFAAGTEFEQDFSLATIPIRKMSQQDFVRLTIARAAEYGMDIQFDPSVSLVDQMKHGHFQVMRLSGQRIGYTEQTGEIQNLIQSSEMEALARFLVEGDLHDSFWHWLDRLYYQIYQPWRSLHETILNEEEEKAHFCLGADTDHLPVDWLPQVNPLRFSPILLDAMKKKILNVVFLVEPFQLPDACFFSPEGLVTTFADNPEVFNQFVDFLNHLSDRLKALADPNRLMIMRIARISAKDNTEIASFLNVSRPTVSIHAKQLREAGLIKTFEDGRSVRHEVVPDEVRELFRDLQRFLDLPQEDTYPKKGEEKISKE
jgi:DNA-binding transcriptional ArsR family regulator